MRATALLSACLALAACEPTQICTKDIPRPLEILVDEHLPDGGAQISISATITGTNLETGQRHDWTPSPSGEAATTSTELGSPHRASYQAHQDDRLGEAVEVAWTYNEANCGYPSFQIPEGHRDGANILHLTLPAP